MDDLQERNDIVMTRTEKKDSRYLLPRHALFVLTICLLLSAVMLPVTALASDGLTVKHTDWMEYLPDTMQISQINLPGTHDSGTFGVISWVRDGARTVVDSIPDQMNAGIRFFDIRLKIHDEDNSSPYDLKLVHGVVDCYNSQLGFTKLLLSEVLGNANDFVTKHPSEVIILELRAEGEYDERVPTNEKLRQVRNLSNGRYQNVVCYWPGDPVPRLGEVRGKVVVLFKESDNPDHGMGTKYEDNYEWYDPKNITAKVKYQYLTNHLKKYTFRQEFCGEGEDKFVDYSNLRNSADENFKPDPVHSPLFIGTNLTKINDWSTSLYKDGPHTCWEQLYYGELISLFGSPYAGFKYVSLNPNKDDSTKHQRTGWWRLDFPQDHQVTDIIESNKIAVNQYKFVLNNTELCSAGDILYITVTYDNGASYTRSFDNPTEGAFDLGYYPAERKITSVTAKIENNTFLERNFNWEIAVGLVSTRNEPAANPNIGMRRIDTFEVVRDYDKPEYPLYVKKTIMVKGVWLFNETRYSSMELYVGLWDNDKNERIDRTWLTKRYNWTNCFVGATLCRMGNDGKYVKINKSLVVRAPTNIGYNRFYTGDEYTGYTVYYTEMDAKIKHFAIDIGDKTAIWDGFNPYSMTYKVRLDNGQELKSLGYDPETGIVDFGYYPGERTIASVWVHNERAWPAIFIDRKYYQDANAPVVSEYRVDKYRTVIGGQSEKIDDEQDEDPIEIPQLPVTGDNTNLPLLSGMLVLSLGVLAVLLRRRKTR